MKNKFLALSGIALLGGQLLGACGEPENQKKETGQEQTATKKGIPADLLEERGKNIKLIFDEALSNGQSYENLRFLCKNIGTRMCGSPGAEKAVKWAESVIKQIPSAEATLQEVEVPNWKRNGKGKAKIAGGEILAVTALGHSVGTPAGGVEAEVIEIKKFKDFFTLQEKDVKGKIVFFNERMDPTNIRTFESYSETGVQRHSGALEAGKLGAVAVVVRSLSSTINDFPHTGVMRYEEGSPKIPAGALSTLASEKLSKALAQNPKLKLQLQLDCGMEGTAQSYNVIGEIRGSEFPDEVILVGGHLDSWDLGEGAHDDGAGCVQAIEVLRIFQKLGIKPKRTIRAVLFMNEEQTGTGGKTYAEKALRPGEKNIAAIESDAGGFAPRGFSVVDSVKLDIVKQWKSLFSPYLVDEIITGYGGADIRHLEGQGTLLIGFMPDSQRYFEVHHSDNDVFEQVNQRELELGAASMAALAYLLSEEGLKVYPTVDEYGGAVGIVE